jgi:23S rRNA pseudouridine2605 synthase
VAKKGSGSTRPDRGAPPKVPAGEGDRLQKILSAAGVCSRRAAEELILQGRVSIDGRVVRELGTRADPTKVRIEVDGERIPTDTRYRYLALNKPTGVITTAMDPQGRPTVIDLVRTSARVVPVGRLDADTVGLVLLTNHGDLAHRLTHPSYEVERVYVAEVQGVPERPTLDLLTQGIELEDGLARARRVRMLGKTRTRSQVEIVMTEGRKHEVRRMLAAIEHPVIALARTAFGPIRLGDLAPKESRHLTQAEVGSLLQLVGL